jgi:tetratricopeptide (TPR) repeat protein
MKKIAISGVVAISILSNGFIPTAAKAGWNPSSWFKKEDKPVAIKFEDVYPVPFYKTGAFKWSAIAVASVAVAIASVASGGVAAVPGATWIGSLVGGAMGTTWTAGLAMLGGGALATGGFGMAGGAVVIATITDLSMAVLVDGITSVIPENKGVKNEEMMIFIRFPEWEKGTDKVVKALENIKELKEKFKDGDISESLYKRNLRNYMEEALDSIPIWTKNVYDLVNAAIFSHNLGKHDLAKKYIEKAYIISSDDSSYIYYLKAVLSLYDGDTQSAISYLDSAIEYEKDALLPYILESQILLDQDNKGAALDILKQGLSNYDDDNFQLNYLAGMIAYDMGVYGEALEYFKTALSNVSINPIEGELKARIAASYYRLGNFSKAKKWFDDAMDEVSDKEYTEYRKNLNNLYYNKLIRD